MELSILIFNPNDKNLSLLLSIVVFKSKALRFHMRYQLIFELDQLPNLVHASFQMLEAVMQAKHETSSLKT